MAQRKLKKSITFDITDGVLSVKKTADFTGEDYVTVFSDSSFVEKVISSFGDDREEAKRVIEEGIRKGVLEKLSRMQQCNSEPVQKKRPLVRPLGQHPFQ